MNPFVEEPWALLPLPLIFLANHGKAVASLSTRLAKDRPAGVELLGTVAVLPIHGVITDRFRWPGVVSWAELSVELAGLVKKRRVGRIVLDIDSPGGSAYGLTEFADQVFQARSIKPIIAIAHGEAGSGAYWVGCQASRFYVVAGGQVGGIGIRAVHVAPAAAGLKRGGKAILIEANDCGTDSPAVPHGADACGDLRQRVNECGRAFLAAVARGRSVSVERVRQGMGQGRMLGAGVALREGLVDGIASLKEVLAGEVRHGIEGSSRTVAIGTEADSEPPELGDRIGDRPVPAPEVRP